jgi:pilus assembly protein CpaE
MAPRILIVDDSPMNLKVVAASLAPEGYEIVLAHNGYEAIERAIAQPPDVVILDVMMPDLDGYEVCRRLRRNPTFGLRPIMMLTANDTLQERIQGLEAGADDYMSKPFEPAELQLRIKALLRRTRPAPTAPLVAHGKVIAVFSLRGGIGVSSLAANLAVGLSQLWGSSTALVDLAFSSGQSALLLNLPLRKTWGDLAALPIAEIDSSILDRVLLAHDSGVRVLATGARPEKNELITGAHITHVIQQLRERFPYVVLDLPHDFQETSLAALDAANQILLVVAPEIASVCAAAGAIDVFQQLDYSPEKITLVLNTTIERGGLAIKDIEQTLNQTIPLTLPYASELFVRALNRGIPLVTEHAAKPLGMLLEDWAFLLSTEAQRRERPAQPTPAWQRLAQRAQQRRTAR